jgi:hypothetical protein
MRHQSRFQIQLLFADYSNAQMGQLGRCDGCELLNFLKKSLVEINSYRERGRGKELCRASFLPMSRVER